MDIRKDDLGGADIIALLRLHVDHLREITPPGSSHALDLDGLRRPDIRFWSMWDGPLLLGCGALKHLDSESAEIKSMHTIRSRRGEGLGQSMLDHLLAQARLSGYRAVLLETGSFAAFLPARCLYEKNGFDYCAPFADYRQDPNSVFMRKALY
jgi:putative acetyltransferase